MYICGHPCFRTVRRPNRQTPLDRRSRCRKHVEEASDAFAFGACTRDVRRAYYLVVRAPFGRPPLQQAANDGSTRRTFLEGGPTKVLVEVSGQVELESTRLSGAAVFHVLLTNDLRLEYVIEDSEASVTASTDTGAT